MRVISLGWGVQSFALAAMSALGELPTVDVAIHSDTTHERNETYAFAEKWTPWLEARGVRVVTVYPYERYKPAFDVKPTPESTPQTLLPVFTRWPDGRPSGTMRRQCTGHWKIRPVRRWLQSNRNGESVEVALGITLDELERAKPSEVKFEQRRFPFLELKMYRWQVIQWLNERGLGVPVKSSCVFCPYHDRATWREIKMSEYGDWQRAVDVDESIRHKRPNFVCYVHRDRVPLVDVDMRSEQDHGQLSLWDEECEGYCFL